ncbi:MAG TPA: AI-2E family transporter [Candidatus Pullilachnospira gallistercoris]|uniref:AI-2E family transporter n=1 Tax=Candidatus Pullilachnospira gallistercoris TaxID=2840911 RepID=A0A9D1JAS4_9FIRM|nr:AI-2E family transporter [Candidatus Pullilachnospira gallistercoris]
MWSKENVRQIRNLILFAAVVVLCVMYSGQIVRWIFLGIDILEPFAVGGMIAFVLNLPMKFVEERLLGRWKGKAADKLRRPLSLLAAIVFVAVLIVIVVMAVLPQLGRTINDLGQKIPEFFQQVVAWLGDLERQYPQLGQYLGPFLDSGESLEQSWASMDQLAARLMDFLKEGGVSVITTTIGVASGIIGTFVKGIISFIFALYILAAKEKLADQGKRILHAFAPEKVEKGTLSLCSLLYRNFSHFITGQCVEAVIIGTIFVITMSLFRMPYAVMIGVLIAFTALIPVVGAFIGCILGAFLILVDAPEMAFWFVVLFLIIQQIEGNLIYPRVVGESVGLPAIWVLAAVSVGGSLFGFAGMLVFIPLVSTGYMLLRDEVNARNRRREASGDSGDGNAGEIPGTSEKDGGPVSKKAEKTAGEERRDKGEEV